MSIFKNSGVANTHNINHPTMFKSIRYIHTIAQPIMKAFWSRKTEILYSQLARPRSTAGGAQQREAGGHQPQPAWNSPREATTPGEVLEACGNCLD